MRNAVAIAGIFLISLAATAGPGSPALAGPTPADPERPCRIELHSDARAACLGHLADQMALAMAQRIDQVLGGLQAATGPELRDLGGRYHHAQELWEDVVRMRCAALTDHDPLRTARCRVWASRSRADQVEASLARVARDYGGPETTGPEVPGIVEALLPLPAPPGGPPVDLRVPLAVPILP